MERTRSPMAVARADVFEFDAFLSYATDPDYRLSQRVESFLESFHRIKTPANVQLKPLQICRDGSDFRLAGSGEEIKETLEKYLARSKYLLVLCSAQTPARPYIRFEIDWFLKHRGAEFILVAITQGADPARAPEEVMPASLIACGLSRRPFYDLRGYRSRQARGWLKVRDMDEQLANLAAHLEGDSAGKLLPIWQRDARARARTRLAIAVGTAVLMLVIAIFALVQRRNALQNEQQAIQQKQQADASAELARQQAAAARNFGLFSAGSLRTDDPTLQVVILREVMSPPMPNGWAATAMAATRQAVAEDILEAPGGAVLSVAFSRDGKRMATGLDDGRIWLWDAQGQRSRELTSRSGAILSVAFSADGRQLLGVSGTIAVGSSVTGHFGVLGGPMQSDRSARVWNAERSQEPLITSAARASVPPWATFAARSAKVFAVSDAGVIDGWNADGTGHAITFDAHRQVRVAAFSPDGEQVALGLLDGFMVLRCDGSGAPVTFKTPHAVEALSFSPDAERLAVGTNDGTIRVWPLHGSGKPCELRGHSTPLKSLVFSADGRRLIASSPYETARLWTMDGSCKPGSGLWFEELSARGRPLLFATFGANDSKILGRLDDGSAFVWNAYDLTQSNELRGHTGHIMAAAFSDDGQAVLTGSLDGTARRWNVAESERVVELGLPSERIVRAEFDAGGTRILTLTGAGKASIWSAEDPSGRVDLESAPGPILSAVFSPDGARILASSNDGSARVFGADGHTLLAQLAHGSSLRSARFTPDGRKVLSGGCDGSVKIWNADGTGKPIDLPFARAADSDARPCLEVLASNADGSAVAAAAGAVAYLWRAGSTAEPSLLEGHTAPIASIAFSGDGTRVLTSARDQTARIWSTSAPGEPIVLADANDSAAFSPDGTRVITGTRLGFFGNPGEFVARVWDADGREPPVLLSGHTDRINGVAFSADGTRIITASDDGTARIWSAGGTDAPVVLAGWRASVQSAALTRDHDKALTVSDDGIARVWRLDARTLLWRKTSYCLPAERRTQLLGEPTELAREGERRCRELVHRCRESTAACRAAVLRAYGSP